MLQKKAGKKGKLIPPGNTGIAQGCNKARREHWAKPGYRDTSCALLRAEINMPFKTFFKFIFRKKNLEQKWKQQSDTIFFKWQWIIWTKVQRGRIWGRHSAVGKCLWEDEAFCFTALLCLGFYRPLLTYSASSWKTTRNPLVDSDN